MKKTTKRLQLDATTVRSLNVEQLARVNGRGEGDGMSYLWTMCHSECNRMCASEYCTPPPSNGCSSYTWCLGCL